MPTNTARYGFTVPEQADATDVPQYMLQLAQEIETALGALSDVVQGYAPGGPAWSATELQTGWSAVPGYEPIVTKVGRTVHIRGMAKLTSGSWTNPIILLPSAFRPAEQQAVFTYCGDSARSKVAIFFTADGTARISAGYSQTIALNTIVPIYGQIALG